MGTLKKNTAFIMLALPRWDGAYASASFALSKEISRTHKTFYIDNPFTLKDVICQIGTRQIRSRLRALIFGKHIYKKISGEEHDLTVVTPFLMLPINWISNHRIYNWFSRLNNLIFSMTIKRIMRDYQLEDYIFINSYNPFYARSFPAAFKPKLFIYHAVDDISESLYVAKHGPRLEEEAVKKANFTLATSEKLKRLKEKQSDRVYYLPNAADVSIINRAYKQKLSKPAELEHIQGEVIIYTGHLDQRINTELLIKIAEKFQDKTLLLIGPVSLKPKYIKALRKYRNIVFAGKKELTELPFYLQYAHCAVIPFKCNTLTESIYPLKINEYLATGLPVVSTSFSEDILKFKETTYIAEDEKSFINYISIALAEDRKDFKIKRVEEAKQNTWSNRVQQLYRIIEENMELQLKENYVS